MRRKLVRICESVFEISKEFLKKDSIVFINEKGIEDTSILMLNKGVKKFPIKEITKGLPELAKHLNENIIAFSYRQTPDSPKWNVIL